MVECSNCKTEMIQSGEKEYQYKCPKCGHGAWVFPMTRKELRKFSRQAYLDARHYNHGGGLNK